MIAFVVTGSFKTVYAAEINRSVSMILHTSWKYQTHGIEKAFTFIWIFDTLAYFRGHTNAIVFPVFRILPKAWFQIIIIIIIIIVITDVLGAWFAPDWCPKRTPADSDRRYI